MDRSPVVSATLAALALLLAPAPRAAAQCSYPAPVTAATCEAAKLYNAQTGGVSLLVFVDGQKVCEDYRAGSGVNVPHELWSCTKSFSSMIAATAIEDGVVGSWDERLALTLPEWEADERKSRVTLRQLLSLTSGIQAEVSGTPTYAEAIAVPATHEPGTFWEYGSVPYQIFGEFMRRRLAPAYPDPLAYLQARVFARIGAAYSGWTRGADGYPILPWGSQWTPSEYVKYGELVRHGGFWPPTGDRIVDQERLDAAFHASAVNAQYGLTWWLPLPGTPRKPCDAVMAFGLGTQKLYVLRSLKLVAIRQTDQPWDGLNFSDDEFLDRLLAPPDPQDDCPPAAAQGLHLRRAGFDVHFDWAPVGADATGNTELLAGYDVWSATRPDFSDEQHVAATAGPISEVLVPGEAGTSAALVLYQVRARDKCGNVGP